VLLIHTGSDPLGHSVALSVESFTKVDFRLDLLAATEPRGKFFLPTSDAVLCCDS